MLVGATCCNQKNGEDRCVTNVHFQAVFDGHRGDAISEFASCHFHNLLQQVLQERRSAITVATAAATAAATATATAAAAVGQLTTALHGSKSACSSATSRKSKSKSKSNNDNHHHYQHHKNNICTPSPDTPSLQLSVTTVVDSLDSAKDILRTTFLRCHEEARSLKQMAGTTAVVFWSCQVATESQSSPSFLSSETSSTTFSDSTQSTSLWYGLCANAGDSRAVLSISGTAKRLTIDHTASHPAEQERIEIVGGKVEFGRVADADGEGVLQVSRGIGNYDLEPSFIPEPYIAEPIQLNDDRNQLIVMASDGLWDVFQDQEVVDYVHQCLVEGDDPKRCAARLTQASAQRGSTDDTTVVVIILCESVCKCTKENTNKEMKAMEARNQWASPEKIMTGSSSSISTWSIGKDSGRRSMMMQQPPPPLARRLVRPTKKQRNGVKIRFKNKDTCNKGKAKGERKGEEDDFDLL